MSSIQPEVATYDGTPLVEVVGGQVRKNLRVTSGLYNGLQVRGTDWTVPSMAGQIPLTRVGHQRIIEVEGQLMGCGATEAAMRDDMVDLLHEIEALFNPRKVPKVLSVVRMDGTTKTIDARPMDDLIYGDDTIATYRTMSVSLLSVAPDWVSEGS